MILETSLIGKALDFGPKECGFEPLVSNNMPYNSVAFLVNHTKFSVVSKRRWILFRCTKKMLPILAIFKRIGLLNSYILNRQNSTQLTVKLSPFFYKTSAFYKSIRLVSTPSKRFNIKLRTLQVLTKSIGEAVIILETSLGILTHTEALRLKIGGKILIVLT